MDRPSYVLNRTVAGSSRLWSVKLCLNGQTNTAQFTDALVTTRLIDPPAVARLLPKWVRPAAPASCQTCRRLRFTFSWNFSCVQVPHSKSVPVTIQGSGFVDTGSDQTLVTFANLPSPVPCVYVNSTTLICDSPVIPGADVAA